MTYIIHVFRCCDKVNNLKILMVIMPLVLIYNTILYITSSPKPQPKTVEIPLKDIPLHLITVLSSNLSSNTSQVKYCDIVYPKEENELKYPTENVTVNELELMADKYGIKPGGAWNPKSCTSLHKVAIVVPYRGRPEHLRDFLYYMHPFLQKQMLNYRIIIVEQAGRNKFNRGKLFNVGFKEAGKIDDFPCFIFHDVDLIPQNINNIYGCTKLPRHMSVNIDRNEYKLSYNKYFGGAVAILKETFIEANGYSNVFFGWGGEDDDFFYRVTKNNGQVCRFASPVSHYAMLTHLTQDPGDERMFLLQSGKSRFNTDGLVSLTYTVLRIDMLPLFSRILVEL